MKNDEINLRKKQINFVVSENEYDLILSKMELAGIENQSAYLRKMAIDGYVIQLDLSNINELVLLLRSCSNNINQIAKKANTTGNIYSDDISEIQNNFSMIWSMANKILKKLSNIPI